MVKNKKLTEQQFLEERQEVLATWKTGSDAQLNLDEAVAFLKTVPAEKNFAIKLAKAKERGTRTLVPPRAGVAVIDKHIELLQFLQTCFSYISPS